MTNSSTPKPPATTKPRWIDSPLYNRPFVPTQCCSRCPRIVPQHSVDEYGQCGFCAERMVKEQAERATKQDWPQRLADKYADRVLYVTDERSTEEGVWFDLKPGWRAANETTGPIIQSEEADAENALLSLEKGV